MSRRRLFAWTAATMVASALVPFGAEVLGMQLAGSVWSALGLALPFLSQVGDILGGFVGGAVIGLAQWACLTSVRARWVTIAAIAGGGVGLAHAIFVPLSLLAAPVAGALAGFAQTRLLPYAGVRWVRAQSLAAAWVALALLLPFPRWAALLLMLAAALLSAWGIRGGYSPSPAPR